MAFEIEHVMAVLYVVRPKRAVCTALFCLVATKQKRCEEKRKPLIFGLIYEDFSRLLFLHAHREVSALVNELPEESEQFRFLRAACFANIKGSVGLILAKASAMRISIPLDLSSRSFIPLPCFMWSRRVTPLLTPSLVFSPR